MISNNTINSLFFLQFTLAHNIMMNISSSKFLFCECNFVVGKEYGMSVFERVLGTQEKLNNRI